MQVGNNKSYIWATETNSVMAEKIRLRKTGLFSLPVLSFFHINHMTNLKAYLPKRNIISSLTFWE